MGSLKACFRELGILSGLRCWFRSSGASLVWLGNTPKYAMLPWEQCHFQAPSDRWSRWTPKIAHLCLYSCLLQACVLVPLPSKPIESKREVYKRLHGCTAWVWRHAVHENNAYILESSGNRWTFRDLKYSDYMGPVFEKPYIWSRIGKDLSRRIMTHFKFHEVYGYRKSQGPVHGTRTYICLHGMVDLHVWYIYKYLPGFWWVFMGFSCR